MERRAKTLYFGIDCMMPLLSLLLLWAAEALRGWGVLLLPLLLLPACVLTIERRYFALAINYLLPVVLVLVLPFSHYHWFLYAAILGIYAPLRALWARVRADWLGSLLTFLTCNALLLLWLLLLSRISVHPLAALSPVFRILAVLALEIGLLLCDVAYQLFCRIYRKRLRRRLFV